jgi:hypothetical protein
MYPFYSIMKKKKSKKKTICLRSKKIRILKYLKNIKKYK